jgi:DNA-binding MarR family transcriptional regulator
MPTPDPSLADFADNAGDRRQRLLAELGDAVRANQRATAQIDEAAAALMGVNQTDAHLLDILEQHRRMSAGALATEASLTSGAITAAVDRLQRAGYAQRIPDPDDRRRVLVEATERARQMSWELFGPMVEAASEMLSDYSDEQLELLIEFNRVGRELQERQAAELRERLAEQPATGSARRHPATRTERG